MFQKAAVALSLFAGANALTPLNNFSKRQAPRARLFDSVPLDYQNPGNGLRAIIPIVKYPAAKDVPYKGSVLTNPGGPGGLGTEFIYDVASAKQIKTSVVGPGWDIIGFDPRGIGYAIPYGSCGIVPNTFEPDRQNATTQLPPARKAVKERRALQLPANNDEIVYGILIPDDPPSWKPIAYQTGAQYATKCLNYTGAYNQAAQHMNTAVVATDMLSIAKALAREKNEPEDTAVVNYYGISYGTVLGQYFATLYPSNVGKFYLDGVVDVDGWVLQHEEGTSTIHADEAWSQFFSLCYNAGPSRCPFFTGRNSHAIRDRFNAITVKLNATKYELERNPYSPIVTQILAALKNLIFSSTYAPSTIWPAVAYFFTLAEPLFAGDSPSQWDFNGLSQLLDEFQNQGPMSNAPVLAIPESLTQVACTDARDIRGQQITVAEEIAWKKSSRVGGYARLSTKIRCTEWQIRPTWEWYGPVGRSTKTPILFAGNSLDPVTPYENAEKARRLFKGAKMIYVDEIGHTTFNTRNSCAFKHAVAYFQNGTLPGHDNRCAGEVPPFF
ncbi:hypothetical protein ABW20_dc0109990 [Dactylellina cionopaga]|nr:hypothetical protein ABW20_dc0109990 [Dactylellina cionopaga]